MSDYYTDPICFYKRDIKANGLDVLLTPEREKELATIIQTSKIDVVREEAINELVGHNLKLVIMIASRCTNQIDVSNALSFEDLVSAGNIGLVRAAKKFTPDYGNFSSYAYFVIRSEIWGYINDTVSAVRTPRGHREIIMKMLKVTDEYGSKIDNVFIAKEIGVSLDRLEKVITANKNSYTKSLDTPLGDDYKNINIVDTIRDESRFADVMGKVEDDDWHDYLLKKMEILSENEQVTLFLHFFGYEYFRLEDIGYELGLTKERIRHILNAATRKLKKSILLDRGESTSAISNIAHSQYKKGNSKYLFLGFRDLEGISDIIKKEIVGNGSVTSKEYIFLAKKVNMHLLGWRINKIIKKDKRLAAFLPMAVYKVIRSRALEDSNFSKYDYDFVKKYSHKGYDWLAEKMFCEKRMLYDRCNKIDIEVESSMHVYTKGEEDFIRTYKDKGLTWLSNKLGLTYNAVRGKAIRLNIDFARKELPKKYTEEDDTFILSNVDTKGYDWLAKALGRSSKSVRERYKRLTYSPRMNSGDSRLK